MDESTPQDEAVERLRREYEGRLSMLRAPGTSARLDRAMRRPVRLHGLRAGARADVDVDAGAVLAKAAGRTARWLGLTPQQFQTATGLPLEGGPAPILDSDEWARCLALVRLGGRLEAKLGRRGVARAWLTASNLELQPTPLHVLAARNGLEAVNRYLDGFER